MMEVLEPPQEQPSKNDSPGSTKSKCIRSLLMEGWKNRWTEVEWGINIKRVLPRGVSGDVYDLAEGIIQQGLVGRSPNKLMLSFLTHSLNAGIVSFGAVIGAIASYNDFDKHDCIAALLDILLSFKHRIIAGSVTGIGNEEESIRLATSLVGICNWSFQYLKHVSLALTEIKKNIGTCAPGQTQSTVEVNGGQVLKDNAEKIAVFLGYLLSNSFLISMFNIGKNEDSEEYQKLRESFNNFVELEKHCKSIQSFPENDCFDKVFQFMSIIDWTPETPALLTYEQLTNGSSSGKNTCSNLNTPCSSVFSSLNAVIAFNAVLDPLSEISSISQTLLNIAKFNSLPLSDLVMEITRCCFIGLVDAGSDKSLESSSTYELKWAAFTFLKMPRILTSIVKMTKEETQGNIVEEGISKLLTFSPLLDQTDCRSNCDCISLLLKELEKVNLVSEKKVCELTAKRRSESAKSSNLGVKEMSSNQQPQSSLILKAEPTVTSILETLDVDYSKNQDGLLEVLCHMPGKSFELIMIAAAATGNFKHFTMKLLKFNEFNKQATGETEKASLTRALLFDVTFLMLCQISQNYGPEVITSIPETQSCFFSSWCSQSFPQSGSFQCPDSMLENCDPSRVDVILNQLANSKSDFKTSLVKWHEYCTNVPAAIKEVVTAWQVGAVSTKEVKVMLDTLKSKMCCIPIVVSTWLCSYISIIPKQNRRKPMEMLKMLITQTTPPAPTTPIVEGSIDMGIHFYRERSTLMSSVIRNMMFQLDPEDESLKACNISSRITSKTSLAEMVENTFNSIHSRSWLDVKSTHEVKSLFEVGGSHWFVESMVRQLLRKDHASELSKSVGLIFGLMHVDLSECSMSLVSQVIPSYLISSAKQELLFEPKASALARLTVLTISSALNIKRSRNLKKGSELESLLKETPFSLRRQQKINFSETAKQDDLLEDPFIRSVAKLILLFSSVASDPDVSQRTVFPIVFLEQLIMCVKHESQTILQFLPLDTTMSLIRTSPENVTYEFLVTLGDLKTMKGRKTLAKALCQLSRVKRMQA